MGGAEVQLKQPFQVEALALRALLHVSEDEETLALEKARQSLALAEPCGFVRSFADLGPPMAELLQRLVALGEGTDFTPAILAACRPDGPMPAQAPARTDLSEPLTVREEEVLELLSIRLRDKEIAPQLGISSATVKYHLRNLYQKLGVRSRREAVNKAREIHLITPR